MFSDQFLSSSELLEVMAEWRQKSNPPQPTRRIARPWREHAITTSDTKCLLGKLCGSKATFR